MKNRKRVLSVAGFLLLITILSGCGTTSIDQAAVKTEGLENYGAIHVITREEGSGTREVFAEKTKIDNDSTGSSHADLITEKAQVVLNSQAVKEEVQQDKKAIGYASLGAMTGNNQGVKMVRIAGVAATIDNVKKGRYPLTREFNLAYNGELSDVESDFLTYIMSEGQGIISVNYTSMAQTSSFLSNQAEGKIEIAGSTSVEPLMQQLAEHYMQINTHAQIEVKASDSTSGLTSAMQDSCDFAMASRALKDYEKELLTYRTIAKDGVAVIVNEENPVESLSMKQLADIFTGSDQEWIDINQ